MAARTARLVPVLLATLAFGEAVVTRRALHVLLTTALFAPVGVVPAQAEDAAPAPGPIATDRPTDSASPELVPRKTFQLELGYKFTRLDTEGGRTDTQALPDVLARFGISDQIEVRVTHTGWTLEQTATGKEDGFTDASVGAKIALGSERGRRPQTALLVDVSLPVGAEGFSDNYVIPKVLLLAGHTLNERMSLTWNFGPSLVTRAREEGTETDLTLNYAVALSAAAGGPFTLFGEVYGNFAFGEDIPDSHSIQVGTTVLLSRTWQVDVRGGVGFVDSVPDWLLGAGLAFRIPR